MLGIWAKLPQTWSSTICITFTHAHTPNETATQSGRQWRQQCFVCSESFETVFISIIPKRTYAHICTSHKQTASTFVWCRNTSSVYYSNDPLRTHCYALVWRKRCDCVASRWVTLNTNTECSFERVICIRHGDEHFKYNYMPLLQSHSKSNRAECPMCCICWINTR